MKEHVYQPFSDLLGIYWGDSLGLAQEVLRKLSFYKVDCHCDHRGFDSLTTLGQRQPCAVQNCTCAGRCPRCGGRVDA